LRDGLDDGLGLAFLFCVKEWDESGHLPGFYPAKISPTDLVAGLQRAFFDPRRQLCHNGRIDLAVYFNLPVFL
jgi:hypothetical protein